MEYMMEVISFVVRIVLEFGYKREQQRNKEKKVEKTLKI